MSADVESFDPSMEAPSRSARSITAALSPPAVPNVAVHPRRGLIAAAAAAVPTSGRHVWWCSRPALWAVALVMIVVGVALPAATVLSLITGVSGFGDAPVPVFTVIGTAAVTVLFFGWRLGLHPRLVLEEDRLTIINPFRRREFDLADVTVIIPGGDGLRVATPRAAIEAWCVQKSGRAAASGRSTRADRICAVLWSAWDAAHPMRSQPGRPARLRFARPDDHVLVADLAEAGWTAGSAADPDDRSQLRQQVRATLSDPARQSMIAEVDGRPVAWAQYEWTDDGSAVVRSLGVVAGQRGRGVGTQLLQTVEAEIFADPTVTQLSVQIACDDLIMRRFLTAQGWRVLGDDVLSDPAMVTLVRQNPHRPRRGR